MTQEFEWKCHARMQDHLQAVEVLPTVAVEAHDGKLLGGIAGCTVEDSALVSRWLRAREEAAKGLVGVTAAVAVVVWGLVYSASADNTI